MNNSIVDSIQSSNFENNDIAKKFTNFVNNFSRQFGGIAPEQLGPQLVQNGTISQAQFEQYRQIANTITGMNK